MRTTFSAACVAVALGILPAAADLTLGGATGLLLNPTADLGDKPCEAQLTFLPARNDVETTDWLSLSGRYRLDDRTEVHGALETLRAGNDREGMAVGVKRQLQAETAVLPAVAVGAYYDSLLKQTAVYAVTSAAGTRAGAPNGLRGHLGFRWDRYEDGRNESAVTAFAGLEATLAHGARCFVEVGGKHHARVHRKTPWAAGVRWHPGPTTTAAIAIATPAYGFAVDTSLVFTVGWRR